MKLSLFSITAILASFVAANQILAPRDSSPPFHLSGKVGMTDSYRLLAILPVAEPNHRGYFKFGWYGKGSKKIELFFTKGEESVSPVFDVQENGYEMVLQKVQDGNRGSYYRPLLVDRAKTALSGLQSPSLFFDLGSFYYSPDGTMNFGNTLDPNIMQWKTCVTSVTTVETDPAYVEELYFGNSLPQHCRMGRVSVDLVVDYLSSAAVQVSAVVGR